MQPKRIIRHKLIIDKLLGHQLLVRCRAIPTIARSAFIPELLSLLGRLSADGVNCHHPPVNMVHGAMPGNVISSDASSVVFSGGGIQSN
jgi:hypothetical protein